MSPRTTQLGVFAKYWEPGRVKTRLAAELGNDVAAELYRVFVETTLIRLRGAAERCVLCFTPVERRAAFEAILPGGWELMPQRTGDLGQRMEHYFETSLASAVEQVLLLGTDSPAVPLGKVHQAFAALEDSEVVLGPANDGGYYLVGARDKVPPIFKGVDWGTEHVWQQTVNRLHAAGLQINAGFATTLPQIDVDRLADLRELHQDLRRQKGRLDDPALERLLAAVEQALQCDRSI